MSPVRRLLLVGGSILMVVVVALAVAIAGLGSGNDSSSVDAGQVRPPVSVQSAADGDLADAITAAQARLQRLPEDYQTWAELGIAYVEQAKNTVNPMFYPKAEGALKRSLSIERADNFVAMTGMAALEAARHDFDSALTWARKATSINPYSAAAWGVEADALMQLGRYKESFRAIQRQNDLQPGTPAFARASYAWELRGNIERARQTMQMARDDAVSAADKAFTEYYLGELEFNAGNPEAALVHYNAGLKVDPAYPALMAGRAKALWATGDTAGALRDFADVVGRAPEPTYVMEYGELLESLGKTKQAKQQYDLFRAEAALFESNGVNLDLAAILFYANHGDPTKALEVAKQGVRQRPFLEVQDALAWALYKNGKYPEALEAVQKAMELGMQNALFYAHAGLIEHKLGQEKAARRDLTKALEINPWFNPILVPKVRGVLKELGGPA